MKTPPSPTQFQCPIPAPVGFVRLLLVLVQVSNYVAPTRGYITLQPATSFAWYSAGNFTAILDVRTYEEYLEGHLLGVVFEENLGNAVSVPDQLKGCENCVLGMYCKSGVRLVNLSRVQCVPLLPVPVAATA